jgi:hypothetical protein
MDARDATANNADLWTHYLREQWSLWLDPFGLGAPPVTKAAAGLLAEVTAANVAGMLTMFVAPNILRMYETNAPEVSRALPEAVASRERVDIPAAYAAHPKPEGRDLTQREEWAVSSPEREPAGAR